MLDYGRGRLDYYQGRKELAVLRRLFFWDSRVRNDGENPDRENQEAQTPQKTRDKE